MKQPTPISSRAFIARLQKRNGLNNISFNDYVQILRREVAHRHNYIMSNSSYDDMILDLIELGELSTDILPLIKFKKDGEKDED